MSSFLPMWLSICDLVILMLLHRMPDPDFSVSDVKMFVGKTFIPTSQNLRSWFNMTVKYSYYWTWHWQHQAWCWCRHGWVQREPVLNYVHIPWWAASFAQSSVNWRSLLEDWWKWTVCNACGKWPTPTIRSFQHKVYDEQWSGCFLCSFFGHNVPPIQISGVTKFVYVNALLPPHLQVADVW